MSEASSAASAASTLASSEQGCELCGKPSQTPSVEPSFDTTGPTSPASKTSETSRPKQWRLRDEEKAEAAKRYEAGESCGAIAKDYGVSRQSMWDVIRRRTQMRDRIAALPRVEDRSKLQAKRKRALERYRSRAKRITAQQIREVKARDQACVKCGVEGTAIDHIVPVRANGQTTLENLQLLCEPCHYEKSRQDWKVYPRETYSEEVV